MLYTRTLYVLSDWILPMAVWSGHNYCSYFHRQERKAQGSWATWLRSPSQHKASTAQVRVLQTTEWYTLNGWIACYMNYLSQWSCHKFILKNCTTRFRRYKLLYTEWIITRSYCIAQRTLFSILWWIIMEKNILKKNVHVCINESIAV